MTQQVTPYQKQPDLVDQALPMIGSYLGGKWAGAAGSQAGGLLGSNAKGFGNDLQAAPAGQGSTPLERRQQAIEADPATQMRQGKIALASMDNETRKAFEPVLDEGLRRQAQDRKQQYSYGYTPPTTA